MAAIKRAKQEPKPESDLKHEADLKLEQADDDGNDAVTQSLKSIEDLQLQLDQINDEASEAVLEVEKEFNKKRRPVFEHRNLIISRIPRFWSTTLLNHRIIRQMVTEHDSDCLDFCTQLDVEDSEDIKSGYSITFTFAPDNPFFSEAQLTKRFVYSEDGTLDIQGTVPTWAEGMVSGYRQSRLRKEPWAAIASARTAAEAAAAAAAAGPEATGAVAKGPSGSEQGADGKRGREEREYRLMLWFVEHEKLEPGVHDELADLIKDEIWPNPLRYFNNEDEGDEGGEEELEEAVEGDMAGLMEGEEDAAYDEVDGLEGEFAEGMDGGEGGVAGIEDDGEGGEGGVEEGEGELGPGDGDEEAEDVL
ncbi:hypothetical protein QJQ45_013220 [Haematococcus lacustris]|nr:hypothetical protein QJQ45_013220 [Haematococcus lacustris]